jgi:hypothetical protein
MLPYQLEPDWHQNHWYADPSGRTPEPPHPAVAALGLLASSALLVGLLFLGGYAA